MPTWRKQPPPTQAYLVGTPGKYIRRESPPRGVNTANKATTTVLPNIHLTKSTTNTTAGNINKQGIKNMLSEGSSQSSNINHNEVDQNNDTRKNNFRFDLSSHSFSNHHPAHIVQKDYSNIRPALTSSVSIGNVVEYEKTSELQPNHYLTNAHGSSLRSLAYMSGSESDEMIAMPANWTIETTKDGLTYYVDHNNRVTHWVHPFATEKLPVGWHKTFDPTEGVLYINEYQMIKQNSHPGVATNLAKIHESPSVQSMANHNHNYSGNDEYAEEPSLINVDDVPPFLKLYSTADTESDHLLNFNLFKLNELEHLNAMLHKLFKKEVLDVAVNRYEKFRNEINKELCSRKFDNC
uniref:WW domain-containing protein n=1 Tax=Rhabditophanes sp. KR3021 TaxID=114890 RepID=A0AC35TKA9_9BILA